MSAPRSGLVPPQRRRWPASRTRAPSPATGPERAGQRDGGGAGRRQTHGLQAGRQAGNASTPGHGPKRCCCSSYSLHVERRAGGERGARCRHVPRAALPTAGSHVRLGSHLTAGARGHRRPGARLRPGQRQTLEIWTRAPRHRSQPCGQGPAVLLQRHQLLPPDQAEGGPGRSRPGPGDTLLAAPRPKGSSSSARVDPCPTGTVLDGSRPCPPSAGECALDGAGRGWRAPGQRLRDTEGPWAPGAQAPGEGRDTCPTQRGASFLVPGALGSHALKAGSALDSPGSTQHPST